MGSIDQLYQELIVRHSQAPDNYRDLPVSTHAAEKHNPLCGDDLTLKLSVEGETIVDAGFLGSACAICIASASMMIGAVKGLGVPEAMTLTGKFTALFENDTSQADLGWLEQNHSGLLAFRGIKNFPIRIQCARLPWEALMEAINAEAANE